MSINSRNGNTLLETGFFPPCRAATTAAITLAGLQTLDGVALAAGDRVLVKDQTNQALNGLYAASTGNWVRTSDAAANTQFFQGMGVLVALGTNNGGYGFQCTCADDPVVIGTSLITWKQNFVGGATFAGVVTPETVIPAAAGDGVTNDTAALVAFFAAAKGKIAMLRPGATYVTDPIVINSLNAPSKIWMNGATIKARASSANPLVTLSGFGRSFASKFSWEGGLLNAAGLHTTGLKVLGPWNMMIAALAVENATGSGVWLAGSSGNGTFYHAFIDCSATGNGAFGWLMNNTGGDGQVYDASNSFVDCTAISNSSGGWSLDYASGVFVGCEAEINTGPGFTLAHTWDATFTGGYSEGNLVASVDTSFAGDASNSFGVSILGGRHLGNINNIAGNPNCKVGPHGYQGTSSQIWATAFNVDYLSAKGIALAGTTPIADAINAGGNGLSFLTSGATKGAIVAGMVLGSPTGGDKGSGTLNVASGIYLNNTAYTNPDYVLEHHFTGAIRRFAHRPGAAKYFGLMGLDALRAHIEEHFRLPGIDDAPADIFARSDIALEKIEELTLHAIALHDRLKSLETWRFWTGLRVLGLALIAIALLLGAGFARARDNGWQNTPANERQWFQSLMQPDNPAISCCGEADAYEADEYLTEGDHYVAIITDERDDTFPSGAVRPHIPPGTRIPIPNQKMKWDQGNPTIHGYVFIGGNGQLYCYVAPGGV